MRWLKPIDNSPSIAQPPGQIKLTLKLAGRPLIDNDIGLRTWDVWMDKTLPLARL